MCTASFWLCCKNSRGNTMGVKPHFLFSLGGHSKQAGDERDLPCDVPFFHSMRLSFPNLTFPRFGRVAKAEIYSSKSGKGSAWQRFKKSIRENSKSRRCR